MFVPNQKRRFQKKARSPSRREVFSDRFLSLVQESADIFWTLTPGGEMSEASASWQSFTGQKEQDCWGRGWQNAFHPAHLPEIEDALAQVVATRRAGEAICQVRSSDGTYHLLHLRLIPVRAPNESISELILCGKDITTRGLPQQMNEAQVQLALKASRVGMWEWDIVADRITLTDQCRALFGWPPNASITHESFMAALHPADRERVDRLVLQTLSGQTELCIEYRVIWPDGSVHWFADRARGIFNARGKAERVVGATIDITDLKLAEERAHAADKRIASVLENIADIFASIDTNWRYIYVNKHLENLMGKSREEMLGKCIWEIFPFLRDTPFEQACRRAMERQQMVQAEIFFPGSQHWSDVRVYPTPEGLSVYGLDITERKRVEDALRENEIRFRHFIDSNIIGITVSNINGTIYEANDAFLALVGYTRADLAAGLLNWDRMTPSEYRTREMQALKEELTSGTFKPFEKEYITKTGQRVPVLVGGTLFRWAGCSASHSSETLMICFVLDISAHKAVERQKDLFLGIASHELKTPLAALKGTLQLAERRLKRLLNTGEAFLAEPGTFIADLSRHLSTAVRQVDLQTHLINDLLDVSRITANSLELSLQRCELTQVVLETVEDLRVTAPDRSIVLALPEQRDVPVLADAERISQVITNYITNALRYSQPGLPVNVGLDTAGTLARVWVRDQGQGLSEEERRDIWQCFHKVKGVAVQGGFGKGLGLGLYICRILIDQHQGEVGVESTPGQGCTFWFTLPLLK